MSKIEYKDLLYQISEKLDGSELPRLIYMCSEEIPESSEENIRDVLALFKELEKHNRLGIDLLDNLKEILKQMKKRSLLKKVEEFETRRKAQSVGIVSSLKRLATCIKGAVKLVCNFRTIAGGLLVVSSGIALRSCSSLDEFADVFNKIVLVSYSKLVEISEGSLCFTVQVETSSALKELWDMYKSGTLQNRLQEFLVTDEIKQLASGEDVEVTVYIDEQEYKAAYLDLMLLQKKESDVTEEERLGGKRRRNSDSFLCFKQNEDDVTLLKLKLNLERQRRQFLEEENKKLRAEIAMAEHVQRRLVCREEESGTEDLERPRNRRRRNSDSSLYYKARDEATAQSKGGAETKHPDFDKYEFIQRYLQNIQETYSIVTTETSDSGIRMHDEPSHLETQDISAMSRDSKHGKDDPRRRRGKAGFIIGKKGWRIKDIKEQTGVKELNIRDDQVHIKGTEEQCSKAKKIIGMILEGGDSPDQGSWKKLDFIPEKYMGAVIGRNREHLNDIEQKTGATLRVFRKGSDSSLYIKGSIASQKRAIREVKEIVYINSTKHSQSGKHSVRLVHVDTTQLYLKREFELSRVQPPDDGDSGKTIYELKPSEQPSQDMQDGQDGFTGMEKLRDKLSMVLQNIQKEKKEEKVIVDIWCHFGHAYITDVDEDDQEEEYFTLEEIKEKVEDPNLGWRSKFKGGLEKIQVEHIEESLESRAAKEEIRYDFTFYTPTCRYVRVKAWLTEKDGGEQEGHGASSMAFSRSAPFSVMNVMSHALPDEQGGSSHTPCFYMCSQTQQRLKAVILMPSKECDYELFVKTCPIGLVPRTPQDEEEDNILESYLMGMKIKDGQLTLPPVSERPDGFDLFYQRRSRRRIYEYEVDDEKFTLLISKYQEKTVDAAETEASDFDEIDIETDIHLHCKEWDRMLEEGDWEPEQIVAKLPIFLQFLRTVQSSVAP